MIESIVTGVICLVLIGAFVLYVKETNKEKAKLINALIAKTPEQARDLTLADKVAPIKPQPQAPSDLIQESQLSQDEFEDQIKRELEGE
jgi:hypothetical protein